ncbi:MAG: hypothetical protein HC880_21865 [Bacteroidia bacterium]|nr:hypothetical protein [Bacteroidia bacterium]
MQDTLNQERLQHFTAKGPGYLDFARLAAQPLLFSTDLLYKLWLNFRTYKHTKPADQPSYLVVSDLILSSLCRPSGWICFGWRKTSEKACCLNLTRIPKRRWPAS